HQPPAPFEQRARPRYRDPLQSAGGRAGVRGRWTEDGGRRPAPVVRPPSSVRTWGRGGRVTDILVVEDDRGIMRFIALNLTAEGYRVRAVFDANEALAALEAASPDLVILDLNLPSRSGWEVLGILKAEPRWRHLPVAILTAATAPEEERRARALEVADYIVKPLSA